MRVVVKRIYKLYRTHEYDAWLEQQTFKSQVQIADRLSKIELEGYFGNHKLLEDNIWELKWENGRRVYFAYISSLDILILLGGNKNGQSKNITQAKRIYRKNVETED